MAVMLGYILFQEIVCNLLGNTNWRNIVLYHTIDWKNT